MIQAHTSPIAIAPMMGCTDRHFRYFFRLISKHARLYTEMITTQAIVHGNAQQLLQFDPCEHPLALQIGGSDSTQCAASARMAENMGYDEINLNVGCPSSRVQAGCFGAVLMKQPNVVAECVGAMKAIVDIPVTVKTRLGVDAFDDYEYLVNFIETVRQAGCQTFIIHARKAWLKGLNPKQNREIPPLNYARVYQLKRDFPELNIIINGGIKDLTVIDQHLSEVDGVMLGRIAYHNPYALATIDQRYYADNHPILSRAEIASMMQAYLQQQVNSGQTRPSNITRHLMGLYLGLPGAKAWRKALAALPFGQTLFIECGSKDSSLYPFHFKMRSI